VNLLAHTTLGATHAPRSIWFLHGILGRGRNWRSMASRVIDEQPDWKAVLPDLPNHGNSGAGAGPHTLKGVSERLDALAATVGRPDIVVGHSFGGKVALVWGAGRRLWVLDAPPGPRDMEDGEAIGVLRILAEAKTPATDRSTLREHLIAGGLSEALASWLLTSTRRSASGWSWLWDLDVAHAHLAAYGEADLWPRVLQRGGEVQLVRAGDSDRWHERDLRAASAAEAMGVGLHLVPGAGHWVHVDAPDTISDLLRAELI